MADFSTIPIRINDERVEASWFNTIRAKLISFTDSTQIASYANDAAYETAKGSAGEAGDLYFNTTISTLRFNDGSIWKSFESQLNNQNASTNPSFADSETAGYEVGSFWHNIVSGVTYVCLDATAGSAVWKQLLDTDSTQAFTGKTINADSNTISNLEVDNLKSGVIDTDLTSVSASDDTIPSAKATKSYIDTHASAVTTHGVVGSLIGTSDSQTLTNKTIVASNNSISGLLHGTHVDNPSSSVHGVTGSVVGTTDTQTLTNKALVSPSRLDVKKDTYANLVTYATTADNGQLCFSTDTLSTYAIYNGILNPVGGGGGIGGINYIENWDAETDTSGWSLYKDAASTVAVDGTGGTSTLSFSQETTSPLLGDGSFKLAAAGGTNHQGEGVATVTLAVDNAQLYNVVSGEFWCNNADLQDGDIKMFIYDIDNSNLIRCSYGEDVGASLAGSITHKFGFQATDSTTYRIIFHVATTTTSAFDFIFDNVIVGPQKPASIGAPVTEWEAYTPSFSGFGTVSDISFIFRRVGGSIEIMGRFQSGTPVASEAQIGIPPGLVVDSVKVPSVRLAGYVTITTQAALTLTALATGGDTYLNIGILSATSGGLSEQNGNSVITAGNYMSINAIVPIQGYSSGVAMSETTMNRYISVQANSNSNNAITADVTSIPFITEVQDTTSSWDGSIFTVPENGDYRFSGVVRANASSGYNVYLYATGSSTQTKYVGFVQASSALRLFNGKLSLKKGDTVVLRSDSTITLSTSSLTHYVEIEKINTGSQTIAASEKVYVEAAGNAGTVLTASVTNIDFTEITDSHGAWNGSVLTAPKTGAYNISGMIRTGSVQTTIIAYVNGASKKAVSSNSAAFANNPFYGQFLLNKGDTLSLRSDTGTTLSNIASAHHLFIHSL